MTGSATAAELAALRHLARQCGVQPAHVDGKGQRQVPSPDTMLSILRSLGVDIENVAAAPEHSRRIADAEAQRLCEPVVVSWTDRAPLLPIRISAARAEDVEIEWITGPGGLDGQRVALANCHVSFNAKRERMANILIPDVLEPSVYTAIVRSGTREQRLTLLRAERRCYRRAAGAARHGDLGAFLPLYAAHRDDGWGAGDLSDLSRLMTWASACGCTMFGTLPLLACFLDHPFEPSPYSPVSREVFSELFIDVGRAIDDARDPAAQRLFESSEFQRELQGARSGELVDYAAVWRIKRKALATLADSAFQSPARRSEIERFAAAHPAIAAYARFRGACARHHATWSLWPASARAGTLHDTDIDECERRLFVYAQWLLAAQFDEVLRVSDDADCHLYLDLPLGVHAEGFDTWRHQHLFARGVAVGAPPDAFFGDGQCWGFPPIIPEASRHDGHTYFAESVSRHLQVASALRLDHVAGLHRCYFVPDGMSPHDGAYVKQPAEEFYALLAILSHRHQSTLIGENLGTVPRSVNRALRIHSVLGMEIAQFSLGADEHNPILQPDDLSLAALNTHDMPPFAAFWTGDDIDLYAQLGVFDDDLAAEQRQRRAVMRHVVLDGLHAAGELDQHDDDVASVVRAILRHLAASPADVVLLNLEDLWLEKQPQNVPGISAQYPNWRRRAARTVDEILRDTDVASFLSSLGEARHAAGASIESTH
jgi:4-alpha-glucanotransferase